MSQEVIELMKTTVGVESFTREYAAVQRGLTDRRQDRKRKKAMEVLLTAAFLISVQLSRIRKLGLYPLDTGTTNTSLMP